VLRERSASISSVMHVPSPIYLVSHIARDVPASGGFAKLTAPIAMTPIPYSPTTAYPSAEPVHATASYEMTRYTAVAQNPQPSAPVTAASLFSTSAPAQREY
jgi:hypothetical protein